MQLRPLPSTIPVLLTSLWLLLACNLPFWAALIEADAGLTAQRLPFLFAAGIALWAYFNLVLTLLAWRWIGKPLIVILLLVSAVATHFIQQYGVHIDVDMMRNIMRTTPGEVSELLGPQLLLSVLVLGVLPATVVARWPIAWRPWPREALSKLMVSTASLLIIGAIVYLYQQDFARVRQNHPLLTPVNVAFAADRYLNEQSHINGELLAIGQDAHLAANAQHQPTPTLLVVVIGESARADHFGLNGYSRDTTPQLARAGLLNFPDVSACGTSTAISLPCMFSNLTRDHYSAAAAANRQNLLDVLSHAGIAVQWRINTNDCEGVCARVAQEDMPSLGDRTLCQHDSCLDEMLLHRLPERIAAIKENTVLVLHQRGSHGPGYFLRYPPAAARFLPDCQHQELKQCSQQEIINAYDNSIAYTDQILASIITMLKTDNHPLNSALLYVSDHGESLGEYGLYLHGTPYAIAPAAQKQVPMLAWLSPNLLRDTGINSRCTQRVATQSYSHDNFFHTVLGMMQVETTAYDRGLDIFAACR
ncbi:MAG: phosphoethanolamine--lipid A transferase [Gammaproteobacteria bacterium]|nr:phosphoethanolamine--lipid A transferase [Gammaproteobacteria bacterium]